MLTPKKQDPLEKKLSQINHDAEERDAERRAKRLGLPYADLTKIPIALEAIRLLSEESSRSAQAAAIQLKSNEVAIAVYDPSSPAVAEIKKGLTERNYAVKFFLVSRSSLEQAWYLYKYVSADAKGITGKVDIEKKEFEELLKKLVNLGAVKEEMERILRERLNTTALLEVVLAGALASRASDIHLEAEEKAVRVRFRLDGILHDAYGELPDKNYEALVTRIKLLSGLKMNVHGEPQDGRFTIALPTKEVEVRVSILPSEFGETIVMRVLDPDSINVTLPQLGLRPDDLELVNQELDRPNGLILNTGPTGSGKTTTLYAFLRKLSDPEIKIITVEDPIEYRVAGIEQTQVNKEVGYTFAGGLRAILRQDPDVILVGEVRDHETADIALQAALTGHLVLSTLHTNDAIGAVPRLADLDVKPATIGSALSLVIAQRLVRKLCPKCKKEAPHPELKAHFEELLARLPKRVDRAPYASPMVYEAVGCEECNHIGYKGRVGVYEFFRGGAALETAILKELSERSLRELAAAQEMVFMQEDGLLKVMTGMTTLSEVRDVTGPFPWEALEAGPVDQKT